MGTTTSTTPCCSAPMVQTVDERTIKPRENLPLVNIKAPKGCRQPFTTPARIHMSPYDEFVEVLASRPTPYSSSPTQETISTKIARMTSCFLPPAPPQELYSTQLAELRELGLISVVPKQTILSVLQKCDGDLDLVLNWFQIREMNGTTDVEEEILFQPDLFSPSISMSHQFFVSPMPSCEIKSLDEFFPDDEETDNLRKFLQDFGMVGYLECLVWQGYDSVENLRYAQLDDLLAAGVKIGHARRLMSELTVGKSEKSPNGERQFRRDSVVV